MVEYLTRTGTVGADPSSGAETELTANFDDAAPGRYVIPQGVSRIREIRVVHTAIVDAADESEMAAVRFKGAVSSEVTIVVGAMGMGTGGTGYSNPVLLPSFAFEVDIPLTAGKALQIYAVREGAAASDGEMTVTLVLA